MSASDVIKDILDTKNIKKRSLAEELNITEQNLYNKLQRDNFSAKELVEIAIKTGMKLAFVDMDNNGIQYEITYKPEELFKPKRKADDKTKEERKQIAQKSADTRKKNKEN